jgi:hypothetical protein
VALQLLLRLLGDSAPAIRTIERHGDVRVGDVDDPRLEGDVVAGQAARIAGAVDVLVVLGDEPRRDVEPPGAQQLGAVGDSLSERSAVLMRRLVIDAT